MHAPPPRQQTNASAGGGWSNLPRDLAADVHARLSFTDRLAFTAVFGQAFKQEAPWLLLHGGGFKWEWATATVFSLLDRRAATVRVPDPPLRDRVIMGSSGGWLVTADKRARMHMINPVTGEQAALPAITTMPFLDDALDPWFSLAIKSFRDTRYGGKPHDDDLTSFNTTVLKASDDTTLTFTADEIRFSFYSKVVLSATPCPGSYSAMLILDRQYGAPAFATAQDPTWRLAPSRDGIEDAIHHKGRFYSITFSGVVEVWEEHDGEFTSKVVTPSRSRLTKEDDHWRGRKYLAAALDGRLMVLVKKEQKKFDSWMWKCFFTVQVLDEATGRWEEVRDIGEAVLFVWVNNSLCVSTKEHPELMAGCVYFTDDQLAMAAKRNDKNLRRRYGSTDHCSKRDVGVYIRKNRQVKKIEALGCHPSWPPPVWFTPTFS